MSVAKKKSFGEPVSLSRGHNNRTVKHQRLSFSFSEKVEYQRPCKGEVSFGVRFCENFSNIRAANFGRRLGFCCTQVHCFHPFQLDECETVGSECRSVNGNKMCTCKPGYTWNPSGTFCVHPDGEWINSFCIGLGSLQNTSHALHWKLVASNYQNILQPT